MRKAYNAKNAFVSGPYSHAIDGGDYIFFSGQTAMNTLSKDDAKEIKDDIARYPLKRYGRPEEVAHAIIYLLSDASSWVTGHALVIDGGITLK